MSNPGATIALLTPSFNQATFLRDAHSRSLPHMADRGFRCLDFFDPLYRPHDASFWQADLAFARADWPGFGYGAYV